MASARPYVTREKAIAASDSGTIRQRWEYGRLLLVDDTATTPGGNLRNGVLATLQRAALKTEREIQYRLQCARAYPTEAQITHASAEYEDWPSLRLAYLGSLIKAVHGDLTRTWAEARAALAELLTGGGTDAAA